MPQQRWKYGNYDFRVNPNSFDRNIEIVGDNVRTLTGALISQPTAMVENYSLSAVFYQPRTKVLSQFSIPNCSYLEWHNNYLYVLNKVSDSIDVFNENLVLVQTISLAALTQKQYFAIDSSDTYFWIISDGTTSFTLYKINYSGGIISTQTITKNSGESITGIEEMNGFLYLLKSTAKIDQYGLPSLNLVSSLAMPSLFYGGLCSDGKYLILGQQDLTINAIYHLDFQTGAYISAIADDEMANITSVTSDGTSYYTFDTNTSLIQKIRGNTVLVDLYNLEKEIEANKFVNLIDDLNVSRRVSVQSLSADRRLQNDVAFDVTLSISKINRG